MDNSDETDQQSQYEGEDTEPTSEKELMGWYAYAVGAEAFAVCGVGSFLPLTLEQLARERGVLYSDKVTPCVQAPGTQADSSAALVLRLLVRAAEQSDSDSNNTNNQCVISIFGRHVNTASFAMYTFSIAVLAQALNLISLSALADYGNNRKTLLVTFGFGGAVASMLFIVTSPAIYLFGSFLVIAVVTCLGSSFVLLNSFLPLLVANHPSIRASASGQLPSDIALDTFQEDSASLNPAGQDNQSTRSAIGDSLPRATATIPAELQLSNRISSKGTGIGYASAVFVQCLSIALLLTLSKTSIHLSSATLPLRMVLLLVGIWWFAFTMVSRAFIRSRPGPPLKSLGGKQHSNKWVSRLAAVKFAWISLWQTAKAAAQLREMVKFLIAWFFLSDAIATVSGTAILFAKTELKMATTAVAVLSIVATISGLIGAFAWPVISKKLNLKSNHTIIACIALFEIIPLYGLLGFVPFVQKWGVIGLQQPWEIYPLGFIHGFVAGGLASYCRSLFGRLIPPGNEAAFYALYAVTDKGSSFFGPGLVGVLVDNTGSIRTAFYFLAVLIVLPIPLIWYVDADRGRMDGLQMAQTMKKSTDTHEVVNNASNPDQWVEREGLLGATQD